MSETDLPHGFWVVGNKMYGVCSDCGKVICVNKFILGSLHVCASE